MPEAGETWALNYIENAATARYSAYRSDGSLFCDQVSNYDPPINGVHLCGVTDDEEQPTTVAAYVTAASTARHLWTLAREVAECGKEEAAFVVDLCIDGSIDDDFWSNRQLWPLAIERWNAQLSGQVTNTGGEHASADQ